ncbi:MAG: DDE-type integrase/transposase/recombinase [Nitrospirae bacterium]|nr:DDE-type integrase/transposase/recombinase [Nitrospirota bacterium]
MAEHEQRIEAISRFLRGEPATTICRALGRSRRWFYKWLRRFDPGNPRWAQSRSRAPKHRARRTPEAVVQLVCTIRKRLLTTRYAQRGAVAIQWQLQQLGVEPLPTIWTINRILKRQGLVAKVSYTPRGTPYPALAAQRPNDVHQLDLVGPRYLQGASRLYSVHLIDAFSNAVALAAKPSKRDTDLVAAVVAAWQRLGIPRYLQVDNELSFRGSNRYPRSLGLLIRLCLYLGVEIVFIPEGEPWRNGIVERFNDVYDKLFFRSQRFRDREHLTAELARVEPFHNTPHRYAKLGQRVPWAVHTAIRRRRLPQRFTLHRRQLPFRDGRVSFVRLTDAQGRVRFFSESFLVDPTLVHEYVTGTIFTRTGLLNFTYQGRLLKVYKYAVTKRHV